MSTRDLEEVLGALRAAAAREQLADLLTTLLTREEVAEVAERLHAIRSVVGERARVVLTRPQKELRYRLPLYPGPIGVLADAPGPELERLKEGRWRKSLTSEEVSAKSAEYRDAGR